MANSRVLKNKGNVVTREYGNGHTGIDIVGTGRTTDYIIAHSDGKVIFCQKGYKNNKGSTGNASYGNCVKIQHANGYCTLYAHLDSVNVNFGQTVKQGQVIGYMGNTGNSYGAHLHFEVWKNGARINPKPYINSNLYGNIISNGGCTGTITYQAYAGKWLPEVYKADNTNNGFAGAGTTLISAFRCKPQNGQIMYEARRLNGGWLGAVISNNYNSGNGDSYAGLIGVAMDGIRIKSTEGYVDYRVKTKEDGWLAWVRGFGDKGNEYAGIKGHAIIGIQMK